MVSVIYSWSFLLQFDCSAMLQANLLSGHCGSTQVWSEISVFTLHYQPYESQLFFAIDYVLTSSDLQL
jgi:hypothetical protein